MNNPFGLPLCAAARTAFFGGRWTGRPPCGRVGRHRIVTEVPGFEVSLCDEDFAQVLAAGLVTRPYVHGGDDATAAP